MNERGLEAGNPAITQDRDLPWLQDVDADGDGQSDNWLNSWAVEYRDVVIVDRDSTAINAYNLTRHDLSNPDNVEVLRQKFIAAAATPPLTPWQQPIEPLDVDSNHVINPLDALVVISELGKHPEGKLPDLGGEAPPAYVDTDGDGNCTPLDALAVIGQLTFINAQMSAAAPVAAPLSASATLDTSPSASATLGTSPSATETAEDEGTSLVSEVATESGSSVADDFGSGLSQLRLREFATVRFVETVGEAETPDPHGEALDAVFATWGWR